MPSIFWPLAVVNTHPPWSRPFEKEPSIVYPLVKTIFPQPSLTSSTNSPKYCEKYPHI